MSKKLLVVITLAFAAKLGDMVQVPAELMGEVK